MMKRKKMDEVKNSFSLNTNFNFVEYKTEVLSGGH